MYCLGPQTLLSKLINQVFFTRRPRGPSHCPSCGRFEQIAVIVHAVLESGVLTSHIRILVAVFGIAWLIIVDIVSEDTRRTIAWFFLDSHGTLNQTLLLKLDMLHLQLLKVQLLVVLDVRLMICWRQVFRSVLERSFTILHHG